MMIGYSGDFHADVEQVLALESAGLDLAWVPEAYSFDAVSLLGYLAARTSTVGIGSGILNVYSRTASCIAQTAAGLDMVSGGRFVLGLGASGPQVVEGFHGVAYHKPMPRVRDYIEISRKVWRREPVQHRGAAVTVPLPAGEGTGLGKPLKLINHPVRAAVPVFWASLMSRSVRETARLADGWLPVFFDPGRYRSVWGDDIAAGLAERSADLAPLQISAGGALAIGDEYAGAGADPVLDAQRPTYALYIGGMGARERNFYNEICRRYGYEAEAREIQDLYLGGRKDEAAAAVPRQLLVDTNLVGPAGFVRERIAAYREAGVTHLQVAPSGDPVRAVAQLRELL